MADRADLDRLMAGADVFLTNLRPGKLAKYSLDSRSLCQRYPRLIHGALSAYRDGGGDRDRAGYDAVLQARTGIAEVTGTADGPPVRAGVSLLDVGSGTWLALGVIAALLRRERTGEGGVIATSLFETGATWVAYHLAANQISGAPSRRTGSGHPAFAPYGLFDTASGMVCLGIGSDELFGRLCVALDVPGLATDPDFALNVDRVANADALRRRLERVMAVMTDDEVVRRLNAQGVACDRVQRPEDLQHDPQAQAMQVFIFTEVEGYGPLAFPGLPLTVDGARPQVRAQDV